MPCPYRSQNGNPYRFEPMAAPAASVPARRCAEGVPSPPLAAPTGPQATLHGFRSCGQSLFLSFFAAEKALLSAITTSRFEFIGRVATKSMCQSARYLFPQHYLSRKNTHTLNLRNTCSRFVGLI